MVELLSAFADGQTTPAESRALEAHLADCPACQAVLRRHRQTRQLLNLARDDRWTPPDLRLRVAYAARRQPQPPRRPWLLAGAGSMVAALLVALALHALAGMSASQSIARPATRSPVAPAVHPAVRGCRACQAVRLARRTGLPRSEAYLLVSDALDPSVPRNIRVYPPIARQWQLLDGHANPGAKGGEGTRNTPRNRMLVSL
jgi:hypothetical protein